MNNKLFYALLLKHFISFEEQLSPDRYIFRSAVINKLVPEGEDEISLFQSGEGIKLAVNWSH